MTQQLGYDKTTENEMTQKSWREGIIMIPDL